MMNVPGSNLLSLALTVIGQQTVQYYVNTGKSITNDIMMKIPLLEGPKPVKGSVQSVSRKKMEEAGLDLAKNYVIFYTPRCVTDLQRDRAGDRFTYGGVSYQCEVMDAAWFAMDGWNGVLAIKIDSIDC